MNYEVISFSGGRSSAMMLKIMKDNGMIADNMKIVFANTGKERQETLDFINECGQRWGLDIVWIEYIPEKPFFKIVDYKTADTSGTPFSQLIGKRKMLPNVVKRLCTAETKIKTIRRYMRSIGTKGDIVTYLGLRFDEPSRIAKKKAQNAKGKEPEYYKMPLNEMRIVKSQVNEFWQSQPFDLQIHSNLGNCDLCFMKGENNLLWTIRRNPELAQWWIDQEERIKVRSTAARKQNAQFNKKWSYKDLLLMAQTQYQFEYDMPPDAPSIDCSCTD